MPPVEPGEGQYPHVPLERQPDHYPRRARAYRPRAPYPENRRQHGREIHTSTIGAADRVREVRAAQGVDPDLLLALSLNVINYDLRNDFEDRFGGWVVDERELDINGDEEVKAKYRLIVQFPNRETLYAYLQEMESYSQDSTLTSILTPSARRAFFDAIVVVESPSREDRIGRRLREEGLPDSERFFLDVDLWHPGDRDLARRLFDEFRMLCERYGGNLTASTKTVSLLLAKVEADRELAEAILNQDFIARADLPPVVKETPSQILLNAEIPHLGTLPDEDVPKACVLDSGLISGHPLFRNWILAERDFETGEGTVVDQNGHGTEVGGLVLYGDISDSLSTSVWTPQVALYNAKVLRNDPQGYAVFPDANRVEKIVEDAIRHFVDVEGCRVFNLSFGNPEETYLGGRQFSWAEMLDQLARDLDIVIVVSTGNVALPNIPSSTTRDEFLRMTRDQLLEEDHKVCNPGTSSIGMTVGAIARSGTARNPDCLLAAAPIGGPSPFTRTGQGVYSGTKPDVVAYGGNYGLLGSFALPARWIRDDLYLGEPTTRKVVGEGRLLTARCGTSLSTAQVTNMCSIAERTLRRALDEEPTANLIRAVIVNSAELPPCGKDWLIDEDCRLRLVGYGMPNRDAAYWSLDNCTKLVASDEIPENQLHIYRIPIPDSFFETRGQRGICVTLAYDPPVRSSRKEYLARTMWFEAYRGINEEKLVLAKARYTGEDDPPSMPGWADIKLRPPRTKLHKSTVQSRSITWRTSAFKWRVAEGDINRTLSLLVGCQRRFPTGEDPNQRYSLVVSIWHEDSQVRLYQQIQQTVRIRAPRVRVEP